MSAPMLGEDVAEACADALLAACGQVLLLQTIVASSRPADGPVEVSMREARQMAFDMVDRIIQRTIAEGARAR